MIWRLRVRPPSNRQYSFVEIDYEIFSMVILSFPLIQEGQLSISAGGPIAWWIGELTLNSLCFSPLWFKPSSGHMWESQVLLTDGQVFFSPGSPVFTHLHQIQTVQIQISWLLQKPTDLDLHCFLKGENIRVPQN